MFLGGYFWHPLANGPGYNFWSGPLADLGLITIFTGLAFFLAAWWRKHNCHVHKCWRLQWHQHPGHGHPVCAKHHPHGQGRGDHLKAKHHDEVSHGNWPSPEFRPFSSVSQSVGAYGTAAVTTTGTVDHEAVVGYPTPEKPKKKRERKPGVEPVTDIKSKRQETGEPSDA